MSRFLKVRDQYTSLFGRRFLNSQLSFFIGLFQLLVCIWALAQHVYSFVVFDTILFCDFSDNSTLPTVFTGVDAIIFDVGLFHSLWGISGCVAQHLDGGYGRFLWCCAHTAALIVNMPVAFMNRPKPMYMWPLLIQQSAYGVGLLILSLAALPRILPTFMGDLHNAPIGAIVTYLFGTMVNFFLLIVYWHFYWHVEEEFNSARKVRTDRVQESHAKRTAAGVRRAPITTEIAAQRSPAQTVVQKPLTNGTTAVHQSNGHVHTTSTISLPTNGHVPNGRAAAIANAMRTSPPRISNGFAPITLLPDGEGGVLRRSSAESPLGSAATTSSGCSSSTPRRRLPVVNTPVGGPIRANGRPMNAPSTQLSTMSLPIGPRLPESQRTASGLGFMPAAVVRTERRPSSARTEANEWAPSPAQPPVAYHVLPPAHLPVFTNSPPAPHLRSMRRYQSAGNWQRPYASPLLHDDRRLPDVAESDLLTPSPITPLAVQRGSLPFGYANEFVPPPPPAPSACSPVVSRLRLEEQLRPAAGRHHSLSTGI